MNPLTDAILSTLPAGLALMATAYALPFAWRVLRRALIGRDEDAELPRRGEHFECTCNDCRQRSDRRRAAQTWINYYQRDHGKPGDR